MKKLLFVLALTFIVQQAFSQMYIVSIQDQYINNCPSYHLTLSTISPTGVLTQTCIENGDINNDPNQGIISLNLELNSIMAQGYKLINTDYQGASQGLISNYGYLIGEGTTFYLALP